MRHVPRLYVDFPLKQGDSIPLTQNQHHYITTVLRLPAKSEVKAFNGKDGEWLCALLRDSKKSCMLTCTHILRPQPAHTIDVWLAFAPLKRDRMQILIEKSTELGVSHFCPVHTAFADIKAYKQEKSFAHAQEAAEQSEQMQVPTFAPFVSLADFLDTLPKDRFLYACLERDTHAPLLLTTIAPKQKAAFLVGPAGGFSSKEQDLIRAHPQTKIVSLGPFILRAETAAITALSCFTQQYFHAYRQDS